MSPTDPFTKSIVVTWDDLLDHCVELGQQLALLGPWRGMVAVARGGLIPAGLICRVLDLRLIHTVCATSYDGRRRGPVRLLKESVVPGPVEGDGEGWLVVDDVADSGATSKVIRALLPKAHIATVFVKTNGREQVDSFARAVDEKTWIHFPWSKADPPE